MQLHLRPLRPLGPLLARQVPGEPGGPLPISAALALEVARQVHRKPGDPLVISAALTLEIFPGLKVC